MDKLTQIGNQPWILAALLLCLAMAPVRAEPLKGESITRGALLSRDAQGQVVELPLVDTRVRMRVTGPVLRAEVTQVFRNPGDTWSEALYLFPLPNEAAVDHLHMVIGDRIVEGEIQEKEAARATYEQARTEGKRAALVEQDRPNLFHTSVANIPPGGEVRIRIEYQQSLIWREGTFSLRFPLAITPRYAGAAGPVRERVEARRQLESGWQVLPGERQTRLVSHAEERPGRVDIEVALQPGFELNYLKSPSHAIESKRDAKGIHHIRLEVDSADEYRDFVLNWAPVAAAQPSAAFFSEQVEGERYGLLMLMPPQKTAGREIPREVIFVIDTSGSMGGNSIRAARKALAAAIGKLSAQDRFNIIEFNNNTSMLYRRPVAANPRNKQHAIQFVTRLQAGGGTEMKAALEAALQPTEAGARLRQIIFITDGSVSQEQALFGLISQRLGDARLFTVGIGSAPNSFFMEEAAETGRGTYTYIATADEAQTAMDALFARLARPALTQIQVTGRGIHEVMPSRVPDLYAGEPLVLAMKLQPGESSVTLSGRSGDTAWSEEVAIRPTADSAGIEVDWAQRAVRDWRRRYLHGVSREQIRAAVVELGLKHHLVTPWTSLVAVDRTPVREAAEPLTTRAVPTAVPHGLRLGMAQGATGYQWTLLLGLLLLLLTGGMLVLLRRQQTGREVCA